MKSLCFLASSLHRKPTMKWFSLVVICIFSLFSNATEKCVSGVRASRDIFVSGKKGITVQAYETVSSENIEKLATHNFDEKDPTKFGFKAVAFSFPFHRPIILFFPTGNGKKSYNVHHRDGLTVAINLAQENYLRQLEQQERLFDQIVTENPTPSPMDLNSQKAQAYFRKSLDSALNFLDLLVPRPPEDVIKPRGLQGTDQHDSIFFIYQLAQGYQFSGHKKNGRYVVETMSLDSSITKYQAHQLRFPISYEYNELLVKDILTRIDLDVYGIESIFFPKDIVWMESFPLTPGGLYQTSHGTVAPMHRVPEDLVKELNTLINISSKPKKSN